MTCKPILTNEDIINLKLLVSGNEIASPIQSSDLGSLVDAIYVSDDPLLFIIACIEYFNKNPKECDSDVFVFGFVQLLDIGWEATNTITYKPKLGEASCEERYLLSKPIRELFDLKRSKLIIKFLYCARRHVTGPKRMLMFSPVKSWILYYRNLINLES